MLAIVDRHFRLPQPSRERKLKRKNKHEIAPTAPGARQASALGERTMFLFVFVCLAVGIAMGYMLRGVMSPARPASATRPVTPPAAGSNAASLAPLDSAAEPLEAALKTEPDNVELLIKLGNLYYDHHAYSTATAYYQRVLQLDPRNVNARTDLGTAYAYSGQPRQAVAEYQKALAIDPRHYRTLFNLGVIYESGIKDPAHAIAEWQKLLKLYPQSPDRNRIEQMIASAKRAEAASRPR